ncbi:MAG TPA: cupredoxin family copper-binding protein [Solirubrobacteraceae bacterium]|jgi:plastocyanin
MIKAIAQGVHERAQEGSATLPLVSETSSVRALARRPAIALAATAAALLGLASGSTAATDAGVQIVYRAYQPAELTVLVGQPVTWRNSGLGPHTVTADAGQFDSSTLQAGATFSYTFSAPGTYAYSCTIHPTMHGKVVVLAALPPGFPPGRPLDAVIVQLSKKRRGHASTTLVRVQAARPGARALLQLQSPKGSSWKTSQRAQLSSAGRATFSLAGSAHHRLRIVVQGPAGEAPLTSKAVFPPG